MDGTTKESGVGFRRQPRHPLHPIRPVWGFVRHDIHGPDDRSIRGRGHRGKLRQAISVVCGGEPGVAWEWEWMGGVQVDKDGTSPTWSPTWFQPPIHRSLAPWSLGAIQAPRLDRYGQALHGMDSHGLMDDGQWEEKEKSHPAVGKFCIWME